MNQLKEFKLGNYAVRQLDKRGIWHVECADNTDLAMLFWRVQEFYECSNKQFLGKAFSLVDYINWYSKEASKDKCFSYARDWGGFNVPSSAIKESQEINHPDINDWDLTLDKMVKKIIKLQKNEKFYLLGSLLGDINTLEHEIAHALFYLDHDYYQKSKELIGNINKKEKSEFFKVLKVLKGGYDKKVWEDEMQAYLATDLEPEMKQFKKWQKPFKQNFKNKFQF